MNSSRKKLLSLTLLKKRVRWKFLAALIAVVAVGGVAIGLFVRQAQKRTTFWTDVGPMMGYRYRITLSAEWKKGEESTVYSPSFVESQGSPIRQWVQHHLWLRKAAEPLKIDMNSLPLEFSPTDGKYPELIPEIGSRVLVQRQLHIDGCAATLVGFMNPSGTHYEEHLVVYVPASTTVYSVNGFSDPSGAVRLDHEMQEVVASFHTEKIPVSRTDLEVIEAALSDWQTVNGREHREAGDDEVIVYNSGFEYFKPHNRKLVLSDMKAFLAAMNRYASNDYRALYDNYMVTRPPWKQCYPHAFALIFVGRPTYSENDTAVLEFRCRDSRGEIYKSYTLKRKEGKWSISRRGDLPPK